MLVSEGIGIQLWLASKAPAVAWTFTLSTLGLIVWLVSDYRSLGSGALALDDRALHLDVGRRHAFEIPLEVIERAFHPGWKDVPEPGMPSSSDYINLMRQATPNVLLLLHAPMAVRGSMGRSRRVQRIGVHVDEPDSLISAVNARKKG